MESGPSCGIFERMNASSFFGQGRPNDSVMTVLDIAQKKRTAFYSPLAIALEAANLPKASRSPHWAKTNQNVLLLIKILKKN